MPYGKGHPPAHDITNHKFGRLTALELVENKRVTRAGKKPAYYRYWRCLCDCGNAVTIRQSHLCDSRSQSCGCIMLELKKASRKSSIDLVKSQLHTRYRVSSRLRSKEFSLTKDDIWTISQQDCFWCGRQPCMIIRPQHRDAEAFTYNGIDRYDSEIGYTLENCVPCCDQCNIAKCNYTPEEFRDWIDRVYHKQFVRTHDSVSNVE